MAKRDYYDVLGVSKNSTPEQIKAGYRKQAVKYHALFSKAAPSMNASIPAASSPAAMLKNM